MTRKSFSAFAARSEKSTPRALLIEWIKSHPQEKLPSIREISHAIQVSSRDLVSVLEGLRTEGWIETRKGSGSWPKGNLPPVSSNSGTKVDRSKLALDLRECIVRGVYPTGIPLPAAKILAKEWNCHPQTVSKVLDDLVLSGTLEKAGRSWRVPRPKPARTHHRPKILLVGAKDDLGQLRMDTDREIEFWRDVSAEASRNGLETARCQWSKQPIQPPPGTLGIVISTWHIPDEVEPMLQAALSTKLPVCTWLEGMDAATTHTTPVHPRLKLHDVAHSRKAGEDLGHFLLGLGHRRIAWLSPFHAAAWSRARQTGLERAVSSKSGQLLSFCGLAQSDWSFRIPAWNDAGIWSVLPVKELDLLTGGRSRSIVAKSVEELARHRLRESFEPLLRSALESNATAWVACNDEIALLAKNWLEERNAWDPSKISVAGFDDSSTALRQDLTSYRFDTGEMARSMLLQILSDPRGTRSPRIQHHGGTVIPRGSTTWATKG